MDIIQILTGHGCNDCFRATPNGWDGTSKTVSGHDDGHRQMKRGRWTNDTQLRIAKDFALLKVDSLACLSLFLRINGSEEEENKFEYQLRSKCISFNYLFIFRVASL